MGNYRLILIFLIFILSYSSCHRENEDFPESPSEPRPESDISIDSLSDLVSDIPDDRYTDLTFVNDSTGFAISNSGRIIKTTNGGKNWVQLNSPTTLSLKAVQFLDDKTGFIIGGDKNNGIFLKTFDGGQNWVAQVLNTVQSPTAICFLNEQTGYITGFNLLIRTEDGGQNWHSIKNDTFMIYTDIKFKDLNEGIIPLKNGSFLKTINSGNSWESIKCNTNENFNMVSFTTYKTFFWSSSKLVTLNSENEENIINIPLMVKILFINEYQSIGIGQHYNDLGYFPYGVIYITNDTWAHYKRKTYSPSDAFILTAIARMSGHKIMIIGNGFNTTKVVMLNL